VGGLLALRSPGSEEVTLSHLVLPIAVNLLHRDFRQPVVSENGKR
jgi:hypothetical protein